MTNLTFGNTLLVAVVGILVVFFGLAILIGLIKIMQLLTGSVAKKEAPKAAPAPVAAAPVAVAAPAVVNALVTPETKVKPAKIGDETVAVLTAAIAAVRGEGYPFKIRRIVRVNKAE